MTQKEKTLVVTQWRFSIKTCKAWGLAQPGGLSLSAKAVVRTPLCLGGLAVCLDTDRKE